VQPIDITVQTNQKAEFEIVTPTSTEWLPSSEGSSFQEGSGTLDVCFFTMVRS